MVDSPDIYSVPLSPLFSCTLVVSNLHHFSPHRKVGILWLMHIQSLHVISRENSLTLGLVGPVGPLLLSLAFGRTLIPSFPHSHNSGNSSGNCVKDTWDVDRVYNGYTLLHYLLPCSTTPPGPVHLLSLYPYLLQQHQTPVSLSPTLPSYFLGLFFFMAVWCTNTSSLVSFLLMKTYLFLTLNLCCDDFLVPASRHH